MQQKFWGRVKKTYWREKTLFSKRCRTMAVWRYRSSKNSKKIIPYFTPKKAEECGKGEH